MSTFEGKPLAKVPSDTDRDTSNFPVGSGIQDTQPARGGYDDGYHFPMMSREQADRALAPKAEPFIKEPKQR